MIDMPRPGERFHPLIFSFRQFWLFNALFECGTEALSENYDGKRLSYNNSHYEFNEGLRRQILYIFLLMA